MALYIIKEIKSVVKIFTVMKYPDNIALLVNSAKHFRKKLCSSTEIHPENRTGGKIAQFFL